ncbi:MAG: cobalamin B12-binding domain-containing protein [Desulfobacterales bacterium]|jgi:methylmalonyl-CoA mutase C-terminal domain/subunit|nr:cobalamin B12-binding domain-containing protein [Desulfobacterales bacterium]
MGKRKIRVLIAKVGLDGHDRGAKIVARSLMDAGMEVIYTGLRQTPEHIAAAAVQEDVDVVGLSFLSGDHMVLVPKVMQTLREKGLENIMVIAGGIILKHQIPELKKMGVQEVFLPGIPPAEIASYIQEKVDQRPPA